MRSQAILFSYGYLVLPYIYAVAQIKFPESLECNTEKLDHFNGKPEHQSALCKQACPNPLGCFTCPNPNTALCYSTSMFGVLLRLMALLIGAYRCTASWARALQILEEECNLETCQSYNC